jgi:hypothetical protein
VKRQEGLARAGRDDQRGVEQIRRPRVRAGL